MTRRHTSWTAEKSYPNQNVHLGVHRIVFFGPALCGYSAENRARTGDQETHSKSNCGK